MKNIITFLASACLIVSGFKPLEAQEIQAVNGYPQAEYHKAGSILMFTPDTELFDGVIHPDAGLYERYFDIDKASDEHRNYISMLEKQGCTVYTVIVHDERNSFFTTVNFHERDYNLSFMEFFPLIIDCMNHIFRLISRLIFLDCYHLNIFISI